MTAYKIADIVRDIKTLLDENPDSSALEGIDDIDTLNLGALIESKIEDAAYKVESVAPRYMLGAGKSMGTADNDGNYTYEITWHNGEGSEGVGSGSIQLPDDYMRFLSFQMTDWNAAVTSAITEDDPLYAQQSSEFLGIRGCRQSPVVAVVVESTGLVLEFYSSNKPKVVDKTTGETLQEAATVKKALYLAKPAIKSLTFGEGKGETVEDGIVLCKRLYRSICYYAGSLVLLSLSDEAGATRMLNISKELML